MRPPGNATSMFYNPFDRILGTVASIRILRELSLHGAEMPMSLIVDRTGLSYPGTQQAMARLLESGVVEMLGSGRSVLYRLNKSNILNEGLQNLFLVEQERVNIVLQQVREFAAKRSPQPIAIWLYGSVARREDSVGSDVDLMLIIEDEDSIQDAVDALQNMLLFASAWSIFPSVVVLSASDIMELIKGQPDRWASLKEDSITLFGSSATEIENG
ncbi:MAG: nucleotidyltransferase domain-containing protein [Candidatus Latescibacteria bacterium]|nr:nucleotidyltransferase domain-containing protein [Candidatus Latescibacterota bacterium]